MNQDIYKPCTIHLGEQLKRFEKDGRSWFSHKLADGSWCNGEEKKAYGNGNGYKSTYQKDPDQQRRIQRQHSQEMSLRFMGLLVSTGQLKEVSSELVEKYTTYFEQDLEQRFDFKDDPGF